VIDRGRWHAAYFDSLGHAIGGGTSEIMRNIIAEKVLGLPRSQDESG
jgi:alkylation response protein AidB-like acyl-CoA dehydrogenase